MIPKKDYTQFYRRIISGFWCTETGKNLLRWGNRLIPGLLYITYPVMLLCLFFITYRQEASLRISIARTLPYVLIPGISFVLLSIFRHVFNANRPYEDWDIKPLIYKAKQGHSMPSRHVFSAAIISMCILSLNIPAGVVLLLLAALLSYIRVVGGIHYPRDVIVGFLCGLFAGSFLFLC